TTFEWDGHRSWPSCPAKRPVAEPGSYRAVVTLTSAEGGGTELATTESVFTVRRAAPSATGRAGLGEPLQQARLRLAGEPLTDGSRALRTHAVDHLEVLDRGREHLLQRPEVLDEGGDDRRRQPRDAHEHPVAAGRDRRV